MRDFYSNLAAALSVAPAVHAATVNGAAVDVTEASGAVALVQTGDVYGEFSAKLQESPDGITWADVDQARVQSNAPDELEADKVYRLGYLGRMPKVRAVIVKAAGTDIAASVTFALRPLNRPVP